jgi:hemerythrin-like domain-containing protein
MTPTEILRTEHRAIEVVLECLMRLAQQVEQAGQLDTASAAQAVEFLQTFADARHHVKEERLLFEQLVAKGWPRDGGPIGVMFADHEEGRALIRKMVLAHEASAAGDASATKEFARSAEAYVNLLRGHIRREDLVLFQRADLVLTPTDQASLLAAFEHADAQQEATGSCRHTLHLARELADRLGVPATALSEVRCGTHQN